MHKLKGEEPKTYNDSTDYKKQVDAAKKKL
jgi:hypothetical protein